MVEPVYYVPAGHSGNQRVLSALAYLRVLKPDIKRVLDAGCGQEPSGNVVSQVWPMAITVHVDAHAGAFVDVRADLCALPLQQGWFDLVVVRHPDVARRPDVWAAALVNLRFALNTQGILLVTCYAYDEYDWLRSHWPLPDWRLLPSKALAPQAIDGRDRLIAFGQHP